MSLYACVRACVCVCVCVCERDRERERERERNIRIKMNYRLANNSVLITEVMPLLRFSPKNTQDPLLQTPRKDRIEPQHHQNDMCTQLRLSSAWASTQSDQSFRCPYEEILDPLLPFERTAKTLIRLRECAG